jgi:periplasmic divalent cation tolerance protein
MNNENFILVYTTLPSEAEAEKLATHLVEKQLIACANIFPKGKSIYSWEGKIEISEEVFVILKSKGELFSELEKEIKATHKYKTPCILKINIDTGNEEYLSWIAQNCKKP